jgi:CelD/BcsL family acetyltransferase involved in cellulose biosynthesis
MRICRDLDDLEALADVWESLAARSGNPADQYDWARSCAAAFTDVSQLQVITVGAPLPVAIAPMIRRSGRLARLELLGLSELDEPTDFLYADASALAPLGDALVRLGCSVYLKRIPADSPVVAALRRSYRGRGIICCRPAIGCPWIPLDAGWIKPEQQLNPGRRSDLRRARRLAEQKGAVTTEVLSPTPSELNPLLEEAFRVEAAGWKGRQGTALKTDAALGYFFRQYAAAACQKGTLRVCLLRIGERCAAMQIAVESGERFWLLKIGYDEGFARCSPGLLLMLETIRYAARRGLRSYEFLGRTRSWTQVWTQRTHPCLSLRAYPMNPRGLAALAIDTAKFAYRRAGVLM